MEYSRENIYYFQVWNLIINLVPDALRRLFKEEWRKTHLTEWKNGESDVRKMRSKDLETWDLAALVSAVCKTKSFKNAWCKDCRANMKKLRDPRNLLAHWSKGQLSKKEKEEMCDNLITIFEILGLDTEGIESVKACEDFVTPRVKELEEKIASHEKRRERSFVVLPPAPGTVAVPRKELVDIVVTTLEDLREQKSRGVTALHLTGNPGSGKSELARQCGEVLAEAQIYDLVMTLNFRNKDTALASLEDFTQRIGVSHESVRFLETKSVREKLQFLKSVTAQTLREVYHFWLIIIDNVETSELQEFWPETVSSDWGNGQMIVTSQNEELVNEADASVRAISLKDGLRFSEAKQLMIAVSKKPGPDEVFNCLWTLLDQQPLSLALAALEVLYAKRCLSWERYLVTCRDRMKKEKLKNPSNHVISYTTYSRSMIDATKDCVRRMCAAEVVWKNTFHFLASCTSDRVPYDLITKYLMSVPELKDGDEELDEFVLSRKLNSCCLLIVDVVKTPRFSGVEEKNHLAIHTHQVVNKVLGECLLEKCDACKADRFVCQELILTCFRDFIVTDRPENPNAFWANAPIRSLLQPHIIKLFRKLSPLVHDFDENRRRLLFDVFLVFSDSCNASGHVVTATELAAFCLQLLPKLEKRAHLEGQVQLKLARLLQRQQRPKEALEHAERAIQLMQKDSASSEASARLLEAELGMSIILLELGKMQQAADGFQKVLDKAESENSEFLYVGALSNLARVYLRRGLFKDSERCYQLVEAKTKECEVSQYAETLNNIGWLYCCMRKLNEAIEKLLVCEALCKEIFQEDNFQQAYPAINLGIAYRLQGNLEKAEEYSMKAVQLFAKNLGEGNLETGEARDYLGMVYFAQGRFDEAQKIHDGSIALWRQQNGFKHSKFARFLENAGHVARAQRRFSDAEKFYQEAVDNMASVGGSDDPVTRLLQANLDLICLDTCQGVEAATTSLRRSFAILSEAYGTSSPLTADCALNVGYAFLQSGIFHEAKEYFEQALQVFCENSSYGPDSFKTGEAKCWLAKAMRALGSQDESLQILNEACEIFKNCFGSKHHKHLELISLKESFDLVG